MSNYPTRSSRLFFTIAIMPMVMATSSITRGQSQHPSLGITGSYGSLTESGSVHDDCGCSTDLNTGSGTGFGGGLVFELPLGSKFILGMQVSLDTKRFESRRTEMDTVVVENPGMPDTVLQVLSVDLVHSTRIASLSMSPYVQYSLWDDGPFAQIGPSVSLLLSSRFTATRHMNAVQPSGYSGPQVFYSTGTSNETIQDGDIPGANSTRISVLGAVGWNISVFDFVLAPMVSYDLPLTTISDQNATNWKVASVYGSIAIRFGL